MTDIMMELNADEYGTKQVNQGGTIYLGDEYKGKTVKYAVEVVEQS